MRKALVLVLCMSAVLVGGCGEEAVVDACVEQESWEESTTGSQWAKGFGERAACKKLYDDDALESDGSLKPGG